jgi:hypothetical protein
MMVFLTTTKYGSPFQSEVELESSKNAFNLRLAYTITYRVFHHDLLITKLHYIDYKIILMTYMVQNICFMAT